MAVRLNGDWIERAACVTAPDYVDFAPFVGEGEDPIPAQYYCASCTVTAECLLWGHATARLGLDDHAIWGGTTDEDRLLVLVPECTGCHSPLVYMLLVTGDWTCDECGLVRRTSDLVAS